MEKVMLTFAALGLCACGNVEGLRSEDIYGLSADPKVWLNGQVTSARSGAPLPGVSIQVQGYSTASDRNGAYRLDGLDVVDTTGSASLHGYQPYALSLSLRPGANTRDIALEPRECGRWSCGADEFCDEANGMCVMGATLSGSAVSACDGAGLDVRVTIDGKSTCGSSGSGKAYFSLRNLTPGGPHTLSIGKAGYQAFSTQVTLQPGFNALDPVQLTPVGGCAMGNPTWVACSCTQSNCQ